MIGILSGGTMLNNKIDSDKAALLKAMDSMKGPNQARYNELRSWPRLIDDAEALAVARGNEGTITAVVLRACGERPEECNSGKAGNEVVRQQVEAKGREFAGQSHRDAQLSLAAMATLANGLGRFPGRKQVVLFSDGFLTTELESQLKAVVEIAAKNNVRFSTLDSRGLNRDPRSQNFMNDQPLTAAGDMTPIGFDSNSDAMSSIAIDTGGEFLMNRNDLRPALDIVATMSGNFYVLGYSPDKPMDGSYRKIDVRVTRPGLTVRARRGYVATSTPATAAAPPSPAPGNPAIPNPTIPTPEIINPTILNTGFDPTAVNPTAAADTAAPKVRPNSGRNVDALTKIAPSSGASDAEKLANAGWDAYSKGDVVTARETLNRAVAAGPTSPWVAYALGFSEFATGHYDAAAKAWETVRARVPEFLPVYFDLADANLSLGRGADALAILREAARRWPLEPEAQNALGTMLVRRGAFDDAIDVFAKITTAKPADSLGFFNLGRAYHLRYLRLQQNIAASRLGDKSAIGEDDRKRAVASYRQYLSLGGPFEKEARDAIAMLDWKEPI